MPERRSILSFAFAAALFAGCSATLSAQLRESYTYTISALGGIGGALDADIDPGLSEPSFMVEASLVTEPRTIVGVRAGRLKIEGDEGFEEFANAELNYLNVA